MPDNLQESAISKALSSLQFQSHILKKDGEDYKLIIQQETAKISSTINHPYQLSKYSLVNSSSNVSKDEIKDLLKAFGIDKGWQKLKSISDQIGAGIPDLSQAYELAAKRRNSSAHSVLFNYDISWLQNLKNEIIGIAASVDIALHAKCRQAKKNPSQKLELSNIDEELNVRFLERDKFVYKDKATLTSKSRKNWASVPDALAFYTEAYRFNKKGYRK